MIPAMTRFFPMFPLAILIPFAAWADDPKTAPKSLEQQLVETYTKWRQSMLDSDYPAWVKHTASYRRAVTRNNIVSQKLKFPDAMFAVPMKPASIDGLKPIQARAVGPTSQLVYYGQIDVGIKPPEGAEIPKNLLILKFIRDGKEWKFNTLSLLNLHGSDELKGQIERQDYEFLNRGNFVPPGFVPVPPTPCPTPAYVAQIQITSIGYETEVLINGVSRHKVADTAKSELIIGGLRSTKNEISISSKPIARPVTAPDDGSIPDQLEISVFAEPNQRGGRVHRAWHYKPARVVPRYGGIFFAMPR